MCLSASLSINSPTRKANLCPCSALLCRPICTLLSIRIPSLVKMEAFQKSRADMANCRNQSLKSIVVPATVVPICSARLWSTSMVSLFWPMVVHVNFMKLGGLVHSFVDSGRLLSLLEIMLYSVPGFGHEQFRMSLKAPCARFGSKLPGISRNGRVGGFSCASE